MSEAKGKGKGSEHEGGGIQRRMSRGRAPRSRRWPKPARTWRLLALAEDAQGREWRIYGEMEAKRWHPVKLASTGFVEAGGANFLLSFCPRSRRFNWRRDTRRLYDMHPELLRAAKIVALAQWGRMEPEVGRRVSYRGSEDCLWLGYADTSADDLL